MMTIQQKFLLNQEHNPGCSSIVCFFKTIREGKFNNWKDVIKNFNKLVESDDYFPSDKRAILKWMKSLTI